MKIEFEPCYMQMKYKKICWQQLLYFKFTYSMDSENQKQSGMQVYKQNKMQWWYAISQRIILILSFLCITNYAIGQETYEVVSTSMLNVRSKPTTKSVVFGKLKANDKVKVYSIVNSWAEIIYKSKRAYISSRYLRKINTEDKESNEDVIVQEAPMVISEPKEEIIQEVIPERKKRKIGIDFLPTLYGGIVNLVSDNASPKGNIGGGIDFSFQFIAKENITIIPRNYYMESSIGYSLRGSGHFPLHYIMAKISPIGYRYKISNIELYGNVGAYIGYTFSTIETNSHSFDSNIDWGVLAKIGIEYNKIGLGFSYERGLNNVCNSNLALKNQGIFFNVSHRLLNLK